MHRTLATFAFLAALALAAPAAAETVYEIELGDQLSGRVADADPAVIPFMGLSGSLASFQVQADSGSFPSIAILTPDRTPLPTDQLAKSDKKGRKVSVGKLRLPVSGRYFLLLTTGAPSDFTLKTKAKLQKKLARTVPIPEGEPVDEVIGGLPGTLLSVRVTVPRFSVLSPWIVGILDPGGVALDLTRYRRKTTEKSDSVSKAVLGEFGDHTIRLGTQDGSTGDLGNLKVKAKHPKPRKSRLELGDVLVDPVVDAVSHAFAFDTDQVQSFVVSGTFFRQGAVLTLEGDGVDILPLEGTTTRPRHETIAASFDFLDQPVGSYEVVVTNPDGTTARLTEDPMHPGEPAFRLLRAPRVTDLDTRIVFDSPHYRATPLTLTGDSFLTEVEVDVVAESSGGFSPPQVVQGSIQTTETTLSFELNSFDRDLGIYRFTVTNPDGGRAEVPGTIEVKLGPRTTSINITQGYDNEARQGIHLDGMNLLETPEIEFLLGDEVLEATGETFLTPISMTFDLDLHGVTPGQYDLRLTNPDGGIDDILRAFLVIRTPTVTAVDPVRAFAGDVLDEFEITGADFGEGISVRLRGGGEVLTPTNLVRDDSGLLTATLDLSGVSHGAYSVEVTNGDGGEDTLADAFHVLGTFEIVDGDTAGRPAVVHDPSRDEHLVVYEVSSDIRARRFSADTGEPIGAEIAVTSGTTAVEDQPHVAYDPDGDRFLVVFRSGGDEIRAVEIAGGGTAGTTVLTLSPTGATVGWPRTCYNGDDEEFFVVYERGSNDSNVHASRVPVAGGLSQSAVEQFVFSGGPDPEREPDVLYDPAGGLYIVTFATDPNPPPPGDGDPPPDTLHDVVVGQMEGTASKIVKTNLMDFSEDDDRRPRVVRNPDSGEVLVVWERRAASDDYDLVAQRYDPDNGGRKVGDAEGVEDEDSGAIDARDAAVAWDPLVEAYRLVYTLGAQDLVTTEMSGDLSTVTHSTLVDVETGQAPDQAALAIRADTGEYLVTYRSPDDAGVYGMFVEVE